MKSSNIVKIQTYCPKEYTDSVRRVIENSERGIVGNNTYGIFLSKVHRYISPTVRLNPTVGKQDKDGRITETKIEFICEQDKVKNIIDAIKTVHPYEEVSIDIFQLLELE